jgi:hypothetical protein
MPTCEAPDRSDRCIGSHQPELEAGTTQIDEKKRDVTMVPLKTAEFLRARHGCGGLVARTHGRRRTIAEMAMRPSNQNIAILQYISNPPEGASETGLAAADTDDVQVATLAYGLGNWHLVRGDTAQARTAFERSVQSGGWPAFGFIVSEVELRRLR